MKDKNFWESMTYEEYTRFETEINTRLSGDAKLPFKIEPFCAQVAWLYPKECPVYPYNYNLLEDRGSEPCIYLYKKGFENYRCPNIRVFSEIFKPIIKNGTDEQKKSLEFLADMVIRYNTIKKPPMEPDGSRIHEAIEIYLALGLNKKADNLKKVFPTDYKYAVEQVIKSKNNIKSSN